MDSKQTFTRLVDLLPRILQHHKVASGVSAAQVINRWPSAAKAILNIPDETQAKALHIKDGVLTVSVTNSSLSQAIQTAKLELLKEINKDFDTPRVTDIRFSQK